MVEIPATLKVLLVGWMGRHDDPEDCALAVAAVMGIAVAVLKDRVGLERAPVYLAALLAHSQAEAKQALQ